jgi:hypothetical protein
MLSFLAPYTLLENLLVISATLTVSRIASIGGNLDSRISETQQMPSVNKYLPYPGGTQSVFGQLFRLMSCLEQEGTGRDADRTVG